MIHLQIKEDKHKKLRGGVGQCSQEPSERVWPCRHLNCRLPAFRSVKKSFLLCQGSHSACENWLQHPYWKPAHQDYLNLRAETTGEPQYIGLGMAVVSLGKSSFFYQQRSHHPTFLVSMSCRNNVSQLVASTTKVRFLIILEARSPKGFCHQGWSFLKPLSLACGWSSSPRDCSCLPSVPTCVLVSPSHTDTSHSQPPPLTDPILT